MNIKQLLKSRGWTQRAAAAQLGKGYFYFNKVVNGHRVSHRLVRAIKALPARKAGGAQ